MKIFIAWSKPKSKQVAQALVDWLPDVLQGTDPFYSGDIEPGAPWQAELLQQLKGSRYGIICLSQESRTEWPLFEAGKLRNAITLRIDLPESELAGPLRMFQSVELDKDGIRRILAAINKRLRKPIPPERLARAFEKWWPDLERRLPDYVAAPTPADLTLKAIDRIPSSYDVKRLSCTLTLDARGGAVLKRVYEGITVQYPVERLSLQVKIGVDRGRLSDLRFVPRSHGKRMEWSEYADGKDTGQQAHGQVTIRDPLTPRTKPVGFEVSIGLKDGFCRTEAEAAERFRNAFFPKEYNGLLVVEPAKELKIVVRFPPGTAERFTNIAPVAFYGVSEAVNLPEYARIEPGLRVDGKRAVLRVKEPLRGQVYGISWIPPAD